MAVFLFILIYVLSRCTSGAKEHFTKFVCENSTETLTCTGRETIRIVEATFGRTDISTCKFQDVNTTPCVSHNPLHVLRNLCDDKTGCEVHASIDLYGDPCPGIFKYVTVTYYCEEVWDCHSYTKEELDEIANISYQHVCERQKGRVFTGGYNENFQGCGLCWCCRPRDLWDCYDFTQTDWNEIANSSHQHICERQKGRAFTGGQNENFQGCGTCPCCQPRAFGLHNVNNSNLLDQNYPMFNSDRSSNLTIVIMVGVTVCVFVVCISMIFFCRRKRHSTREILNEKNSLKTNADSNDEVTEDANATEDHTYNDIMYHPYLHLHERSSEQTIPKYIALPGSNDKQFFHHDENVQGRSYITVHNGDDKTSTETANKERNSFAKPISSISQGRIDMNFPIEKKEDRFIGKNSGSKKS